MLSTDHSLTLWLSSTLESKHQIKIIVLHLDFLALESVGVRNDLLSPGVVGEGGTARASDDRLRDDPLGVASTTSS